MKLPAAWPLAPVAFLAAVLDLVLPADAHVLGSLHALDVVVLAALLVTLVRRRAEGVAAWRSPLDGRLAGALVVLACAAGPWPGAIVGADVLRRALVAAALFYALMAEQRRDARARTMSWAVFPLAAVALGLLALVAVTSSVPTLGAQLRAAGARWGSVHAVAYAQLVATVLTAGRACERGATRRWRLATVVGLVGLGVQWAAGGSPFDAASPARLEDPLAFSLTVVSALVLHAVARSAWAHRRECRAESGRWWGVVVAGLLLGGALFFGTGPVGEGAAVLAATAAALACGESAPAAGAALPRPAEPGAPPLARAA